MANPIRPMAVHFGKARRHGDLPLSQLQSPLANLYGIDDLRSMIRVAILGASGYSALELIRILLRHPEVTITALTTRNAESRSIGEVHPSLSGRLDVRVENLPTDEIARRADCVFCCLPHGASAAA